jgi:hypothetical protein
MSTFIPEDLTWAIMQEREAVARAAVATGVPRPRRRPLSVKGALARRIVSLGVWLDGGANDITAPARKRHCSHSLTAGKRS